MRDSNKLRIIGGKWRGSRLSFPTLADLRPTADRVRETLFNWLQQYIEGSECLDLFAGSGALGFEALSRGARKAVLVDTDSMVIKQLDENAQRLRANVEIVRASAGDYLNREPQPFNIVFLDPPFRFDILAKVCQNLELGGWLAPDAWIYIESPTDKEPPAVPAQWQLHRDKLTGAVRYQLFRREAVPAAV